ncbi:hypothetical protein TSOC_014056, partial [Tetrabaena socialis]
FEVLGVDFLLNATFHPTLVEVNALPSLARLRTAPGDPAAAAAAAAAGNTTAAAAGPAAPFDAEKERFLHHALRLVGLPLGPPPERTAAVAAAVAAGAVLPTVGGVLRAMVSLLRPPNNETAELQAHLRRHWPADVAAAAEALPLLRPMLCPVPAAWGPAPGWPVIQEGQPAAAGAGVAGAAATVGAAGGSGGAGGRRLAAAGPDGLEGGTDAGPGLGLGAALGGGAAGQDVAAAAAWAPWGLAPRAAVAQAPQHRAGGPAAQAGVAAHPELQAAAAGGGMAAAVTLGGAVEAGPLPAAARRRRLQDLGAAGATGGGGGAATAAAAAAVYPCRSRCFEWDVLGAIAETEAELQQGLDFEPVFPMAAARQLNSAALARAGAAAAAAADAAADPADLDQGVPGAGAMLDQGGGVVGQLPTAPAQTPGSTAANNAQASSLAAILGNAIAAGLGGGSRPAYGSEEQLAQSLLRQLAAAQQVPPGAPNWCPAGFIPWGREDVLDYALLDTAKNSHGVRAHPYSAEELRWAPHLQHNPNTLHEANAALWDALQPDLELGTMDSVLEYGSWAMSGTTGYLGFRINYYTAPAGRRRELAVQCQQVRLQGIPQRRIGLVEGVGVVL